jgi:YD repeat-containing protein
MYEQKLYEVVEPIKITTISRLNKGKKWKYGYNKEHNLVVISRTGQIG